MVFDQIGQIWTDYDPLQLSLPWHCAIKGRLQTVQAIQWSQRALGALGSSSTRNSAPDSRVSAPFSFGVSGNLAVREGTSEGLGKAQWTQWTAWKVWLGLVGWFQAFMFQLWSLWHGLLRHLQQLLQRQALLWAQLGQACGQGIA